MKKNNKFKFLVVTIFLGIILFIFSVVAQINNSNSFKSSEGLQIDIVTSKDTYLLGETVFLNFEVKNNSSKDIRVRGLDLDSNYVSVYISYEGQAFKKYRHSRINEAVGGMFKVGQVKKSTAGILWNFSPMESSSRWKEMEETNILTYYAFPKPGVYIIKAVLGVPSSENPIEVESKPIQIVINEPVGDDLDIWNEIKDNGEFAYFIQEGEIRPSNKPKEREKLRQEIEQIVNQYPNSIIANQIEQSLEKFRTGEEERRKFLERVKKQQKN